MGQGNLKEAELLACLRHTLTCGEAALEALFLEAWSMCHFEQRVAVGAVWLVSYPNSAAERMVKLILAPDYRVAKPVTMVEVVTHLLACCATSKLSQFVDTYAFCDQALCEFLDGRMEIEPRLRALAADALSRILLELESDVVVPTSLASALSLRMSDMSRRGFEAPVELLLAGLSLRVFQTGKGHITPFENLINSSEALEAVFQKYLVEHPFILEPFFSEVWPLVRLGESLVADFVVKRLDGSLIVVEIERPSTPLFTQYPQLASPATYAITQALAYRDWILRNHLYSKERFGGFGEVQALAVVGLEHRLSREQRNQLRIENESRGGIVRIVGFDWLADRAKTVARNSMQMPFFRVTGKLRRNTKS